MKNWFPMIKKAQLHLVLLGLFFFIFIHYSESNTGGVGLEVPSNVASWIVISFVIGLGLFQVAKNEKLVFSKITICFAISCLLLSIPTLYPWSKLINESATHLGLLGGLFFYIALQQFKPDLKQLNIILFMILGAVIIEAITGWHNYLGISWAKLSFGGPGSDIPYGAVRQRNGMSTLLVTGLIVSAWLLDPSYRQKYPVNLQKFLAVLLVLTPLLVIPLIIVLKSRTGWISASVSLVLLLPYLYAIRNSKLVQVWLVSICLSLMVVPSLNQVSDDAEVIPIEKLNLAGPRSYFYEQIIDLALEKPILGYGFGNFEIEYAHFSAQGYANGDYESPAYENLGHPHNEILYWWIEGGIVAVAGLLLATFIVLKSIFKIPGTEKKLLILALFFPIVLHTQTEIPFYIFIGLWFIFLIFVLQVDILTQQYQEKTTYLHLLPGILAFLIPLLVTAFMITTLQSGRLLNQVEKDMEIEVSILDNISNPVIWQDRLMWDMNFGLLSLAVYQNRPELAVNYIEWASEIIKRKPRAGYYHYLVIAYKVIGDERQARIVQDEAEFLFPDRDFNFDSTALLDIESKNIDEIQTNMIAE